MRSLTAFSAIAVFAGAIALAACGGDAVSNQHQAEQAYKGLDPSIDKAIQLGFDGYNSTSNANISPQSTTGADGGTLSITGQVDQGTSNNKGMRLQETMVSYSDDGQIRYDTSPDAGLPELDMQLKGVPTGTLTGTLVGNYQMTGALTGVVSLNVSFTGDLQAGPNLPDGGTTVERKTGTTHITGTATSGSDSFAIDITR